MVSSIQLIQRDDSEIGTSIGFSDKILVGVSIVGFTALIYVVHSLLRNYSNNRNVDGDDDDGLTDDERLLRATDVSTLNRAQRRARAKAIMKEQRRVQQQPLAVVGDNDDDNNNNIIPHNNNNINAVDDDAAHDNGGIRVIPNRLLIGFSRKERQQQAKATEKEERRLFQEEREQQQQRAQCEAQRQKRERIAAATQRLLDDERHQAMERALYEEQERDLWYTFIPASVDLPKKTVSEFIHDCQTNRVVVIETMAVQYNVEPQYIVDRIEKLVSDGRIAGFFQDNHHHFIYVSDDELSSIASSITRDQRGFVSLEQVTAICQKSLDNR